MIYGVAGVGKSALACRYAADWSGPVAYCRIGSAAGLQVACEDALRQLAASDVRDLDMARGFDALAAVANALDDRGGLWVIDDLHHLSGDERRELVRELASLRAGKVIATSRELLPFEADAPDRLEVKLGGLDQTSAQSLWTALDDLHGASPGFDGTWSRARGNPLRLRQAHACRPDAEDHIVVALRALSPTARRIATALALSECPLPKDVLARFAGTDGTTALAELVNRMIVDPAGPSCWQLHDLFRETLAVEVPAAEQRAVRTDLALVVRSSDLDPALRAREVVRHLSAIEDHDALAAFIVEVEPALIAEGATGELVRGLEAVPVSLRSPRIIVSLARARARQLDLERAHRELAPLATSEPAPLDARLLFAQIALVRGDVALAHDVLRPLAARSDLPALVTTLVAISIAVVETHLGDGERGRARLAAAEAAAADADEAGMLGLIRGFLVWLDGPDDELGPLVRPAEWFAGSVAAMRANVVSPGLAALLCSRLGRFHEAEAHYERAASSLAHDEDLLSRVTLAFSRGVMDLERGLRSSAEARLGEVSALCRQRGYVLGALLADAARIRALHELGRTRAATELAETARVRAERHGFVAIRTRVERVGIPSIRATPATTALSDENTAVERAFAAIRSAIEHRLAGDEPLASAHIAQARLILATHDADADLVDRALSSLGHIRAIANDTRTMLTTAEATALVDSAPGVVVDARTSELRTAGTTIALRSKPQTAKLLFALASRPNRVMSKDELVDAVWGGAFDPLVHDNTLKVSVTRLRSLLGSDLALEFDSTGYRLSVPGPFLYLDIPARAHLV
ncbi:MAG TPA: winged helix-turn-helix domain-containing protein [Kofleriaceae bacterium]|jgi:tetratricopeptide (TPR) repeat protein